MITKKGISPLIATVLIIGFTIVAAVLVITWINSLVGEQTDTQACRSAALDECISTTGTFTYSYSNTPTIWTATILNTGSTTANFRVAYLKDDGSIVTACSTPSSMTVNGFTSLDDSTPCTPGAEIIKKIRFVQEVTSSYGTVTCTETCGQGATLTVT